MNNEEIIFIRNNDISNNMNNYSAKECAICLDSLDNNIHVLNCGHVFHKECLNNWAMIKSSCPLCRRYLKSQINIKARKYKNVLIRYNIICFDNYLKIKKFYLDFFINEKDIDYTQIKKILYTNFFKIIYNDNENIIAEKSEDKEIHFKINNLNISNDILFTYLKNKIEYN